MNIETNVLLSYKDYMFDNSTFKSVLTILPSTPQSFSKFPTIVLREINNTDYGAGKTIKSEEYIDQLTYQVDIYTKDVRLNGKIYKANTVIAELKQLTADFFRKANFDRTSSTPSEYLDLSVSRHVLTFSAKLNNWNLYIN